MNISNGIHKLQLQITNFKNEKKNVMCNNMLVGLLLSKNFRLTAKSFHRIKQCLSHVAGE